MSKYVGGLQYYREKPKSPIAQGIEAGIGAFNTEYEKRQDQDILKQMQNPDLTPLQKVELAAQMSAKGQKTLVDTLGLQQRLVRDEELRARHEQEQGFKQSRESRLKGQNEVKHLQNLYTNRLKAIKEDIDLGVPLAERQQLRQERAVLQKELSRNLVRLKRGENPIFEHLHIDEETTPNQPTAIPQQAAPQAVSQPVQQKLKWDPSNPQHQAFAQEAIKASQGDRVLANRLIAEHFMR